MSIEHTQKRYKANMELVETLKAMLMAYPDMRFSQALANFGFVDTVRDYETMGQALSAPVWTDEYHKEPMELLDRVKNTINNIHSSPT